MKQGRILPVALSIAAHLVLVIVLINNVKVSVPQHDTTKTPIKSYIYTPKPTVKQASNEQSPSSKPDVVDEPNERALPIEEQTVLDESLEQATPPVEQTTEVQNDTSREPADIPEQIIAAPKASSNEPLPVVNAEAVSRKVLDAISKLNADLDYKAAEGASFEQFNKNPVSVFNQNRKAVPRSTVPLSKEQEREQNTERLSDQLSIRKTENGTCFIEEDLGDRGMEGLKAVQAFNCGESKFDKSFREHMKKVINKLGKKN